MKAFPRWAIFAVAAAAGFAGASMFDQARPGRRRRNPRKNLLSRNPFRAYKEFHWGRDPDGARSVAVPSSPKELVELGTLENVTYSTIKGDEDADYVHDFGTRGRGKPTLAYDPKTKSLHVVGGTYTVEDRGIVG